MKTGIHPKTHPVIFLDTTTGNKFVSSSTLVSDETEEIDGVKHYVIKVEISSSSHPFYTGKRMLVDTAGRVDKFLERAKKSEQKKSKKSTKDEKTAEEAAEEKAEKPKESAPKAKKTTAKKK
ncbi:type B 50S ribosomal protein L31 [Candidatus Peregrinibacteria bacterium]|nr:type B 50S ribosomal protein L31 [Candidatus Peregrinibacteria bacterium]